MILTSMDPQYQHSKKYLLQLGMFLLFVAFIALAWLLLSGKSKTSTQQLNNTQVTVARSVPTVVIPTSGSMTVLKNGPIYTIQASSDGKNIAGFDVLVTYDASVLDIASVSSPNALFQVTSFKKPGFISITGTKQLGNTSPAIFNASPLVSIQTKIKTNGEAKFALQATSGVEKTKFVDTASHLYIPAIR